MTLQRIKCLIGKHDWRYNQPKFLFQKEYWIGSPKLTDSIPIESQSCRFCEVCFRKEVRNIVDFGRTIYWRKTNQYTKSELREINLKKILKK